MLERLSPAPTSRKCTKSTRARAQFAGTRYVQRRHGAGVQSWSYAYENPALIAKSWVGCGLEIGVQLRGAWSFASRFHEARTYERGEICRVSFGEPYELAYEGRSRPGMQVGFVLCGDALARFDGELRFRGDRGRTDASLFAFANEFAHDETLTDEDVSRAVHAYLEKHAELVPLSPLVRAKRELERHFDCDLPIEHVAAAGSLHPATFVRQFKSAYGTTPVAYRIMLRANHASRLLWMQPSWSLARIALESGFANVSYFHRTFRRAFAMSASEARARHCVRWDAQPLGD